MILNIQRISLTIIDNKGEQYNFIINMSKKMLIKVEHHKLVI